MGELLTDDVPRTGEILDGRYRLEAAAGEGGMATVYRANDELLGRTVAIKVFRPGTTEPSESGRTVSETRVLASLNHHALVTLFDARVEEGGLSYLAMEFVEGPTLRARIAEGPLDPIDVAAMAFDLAEALHVVHERGVVHRDIKPSNVLLRPSTTPGPAFRAKLADFGIAYLVDSTRVTLPGTIMGTAAYLSPEQVRGAAPAPSADIYSLGLLLIEALTGRRAFPQSGTHASLMARVTQSPEIPGGLGYGWKSLLTAMTAPRPDDRPSALEVAVAARGLQLALLVPGAADDGALEATGVIDLPAAATLPLTAFAEPEVEAELEPEPTVALELPTRRTQRRAERRRPKVVALAIAVPGALAIGVLAVLIGVGTAGGSVTPTAPPVVESTTPATVEETPVEEAPVVEAPVVEAPAEPVTETEPAPVVEEPGNGNNGNGNGNGNSGPGNNNGNGNNGNGNGR
ncbi:serine/threonine-protein kinase [Herbiconiux sp. VKM Ac-1786]|uniref:serine/threonine-protein kinase n=1 Tax=Herbiconiux sp. VKM Ac-1786 TaxID=2783824 RepID=UPI001E3365CA|nr:serine/threonine-protein kinase [Herbiconiux sp. VKM Ac-1786]